MILEREFKNDGHVFTLAVEESARGWDVQERCDSTIVHVEHHNDWRRVECAMRLLEMKVCDHGVARAGQL